MQIYNILEIADLPAEPEYEPLEHSPQMVAPATEYESQSYSLTLKS